VKKVAWHIPGIENYLKNLAFTHIDASHSGHFMTYASPSRESSMYCASDASNTNIHPQLQASVRVLGLPFFPDTNIFINL
jgi:hypothetical protein